MGWLFVLVSNRMQDYYVLQGEETKVFKDYTNNIGLDRRFKFIYLELVVT